MAEKKSESTPKKTAAKASALRQDVTAANGKAVVKPAPKKAAKPEASKKAAPKKSKPADNKTKQTQASVEDFINALADEQKRRDSFVILEMMKKASGEDAKMWGSSLIGFGQVRLKSPATGREVDWFRMGFSPRKANFSLYMNGGAKRHAEALEKLGKHKTVAGCIYINKLEDVDLKVLKKMIDAALKMNYFAADEITK